jgi:hypothetical protein
LESEVVQHPVEFIAGTENNAAIRDAVAAYILRVFVSLAADAHPKAA